jgi:hypothetical protein
LSPLHSSVNGREDELGNEAPLRNEEGRIIVVATGEPDCEIQLGDTDEDMPAVAAREECSNVTPSRVIGPDLRFCPFTIYRLPLSL